MVPDSGISVFLPEDSPTANVQVVIYPELKLRKMRLGKRTLLIKPANRWALDTYYMMYLKWTDRSGLERTSRYNFFCRRL